MTTRSRLWLFALAPLFFLIALTGLAELFLRLRYDSPHKPFIRDPEFEYTTVWNDPAEPVSFDFRGRRYARQRPPDKVRLLVLGGSTTFGYWIADQSLTWSGVLESHLNGSGYPVEIVNTAQLGWSCLHLEKFNQRAFDLIQPDGVVFMEGWNWTGIAEPLNWSPFIRLKPGFEWMEPVVDSHMYTLMRKIFTRFIPKFLHPWAETPARYTELRDIHRQRFRDCLGRLDDFYTRRSIPHVLIIPPASIPDTVDPKTLGPNALKVLTVYNYCFGDDPTTTARCHDIERSSMRKAVSELDEKGTGWRIIDGDGFTSRDPNARANLFMDFVHMTVAGHRLFGEFIARSIREYLPPAKTTLPVVPNSAP